MKCTMNWLPALLALLAIVGVAPAANAQSAAWPERPVTVVVGFPAGGPTDLAARTLAQHMQASTGQTFIVDNRPGATGTIAAGQVKRAAPDGYTLFVSSLGTFVIAPHLLKSLSYDPRTDFDYISIPFQAANVLVTGPAQPARTVAEVLALLKKNPDRITFASSGNGASDHLSAELLWQQTGTSGVHVPYKGGPPAMQDTLGGQVDFFMTNINAQLPHIRSGKLHPIAITDSVRSPALPDVPTFAEAGVSGMEVSGWQGLVAPKGLPAPIKKKLHELAVAAMKDPAVVKQLTDLGIKIVANTPEEFTALQAREYLRWKALIESRKITAD
jgi:tripartite-type tricarboxylate transporter receptor subunit TctC